MRLMLLIGLLFLGTLSILGNTTAQSGCDVQNWQGNELITDFMDTFAVAAVAPRSSLAPVLIELQARYQTFERADHPACLDDAAKGVVSGMEGYVNSMIRFLADDNEYISQMVAARRLMQTAADLLEELGVVIDDRMRA